MITYIAGLFAAIIILGGGVFWYQSSKPQDEMQMQGSDVMMHDASSTEMMGSSTDMNMTASSSDEMMMH